MTWSSPWAYFVFMSGSGLGVALIVYLFAWFTAPERYMPYFDHNPD